MVGLSNVLNNGDVDYIRYHFEKGDVIGVISEYRADENLCPHLEHDLPNTRPILAYEKKKRDAELEEYFKSFASGLHLGRNKAIGNWIDNNGKETKQAVEEMSFIVYGKPEDKDEIYKLLMAFCRRFIPEGFLLIYDNKIRCVNMNGEESDPIVFHGSLKELGERYASLYRQNRRFYCDGSSEEWSFAFKSLTDFSPIRPNFNSYMDRKHYVVVLNLLNRYGENAFDHVKLSKDKDIYVRPDP